MIKRLDYTQINSAAINDLLALKRQIVTIDERLKALVELRVSQINGCVYCLDLHARQARAIGEIQKSSIAWLPGTNALFSMNEKKQLLPGPMQLRIFQKPMLPTIFTIR